MKQRDAQILVHVAPDLKDEVRAAAEAEGPAATTCGGCISTMRAEKLVERADRRLDHRPGAKQNIWQSEKTRAPPRSSWLAPGPANCRRRTASADKTPEIMPRSLLF